ncbi:MAG: Mrp/NBP35 family ATP-binding protein [Microbacteriaceae bacterium]|nr:Mrp/NBP35 family ATP-binding protein [Microbacteriaceae bacterium]MCI1207280.1 Mrp/NBP35 family ATP-binding protein [Microbacteriaceae bacterium]
MSESAGAPVSVAPALRAALSGVIDPELHRDVLSLGMISSATLQDGYARVELLLTIPGCPAARLLEERTRSACETVTGPGRTQVHTSVMTDAQRRALVEKIRGRRARTPFGPGSRTRVIAVASGKGGVGKSTLTANLACTAAAAGERVGLIDADVYGYSIPGMLGISASPTKVGELLMPPSAHGVAAVSIGMFVPDNRPVSWRGPLLARTLEQFLGDVHFGPLDVLFLDLPPGTGDMALTLGQLLPNAEVLVVTSPQPAASTVAVRAGLLAQKLGQRIVGVVENMSWVETPGGPFPVFGTGGGTRTAEALSAETGTAVPLLGQVPLTLPLRESADAGRPVSEEAPDDPAARALGELWRALAARKPARARIPRGGAGRGGAASTGPAPERPAGR